MRDDVNSTRLPSRRPAERDVGIGMPRQPLRHAALGGDHEHVGVAVVLAGERDPFAVGRERRIRLDARPRRQSPRLAAGARHAPEIAGEDEDDLRGAERRLLRKNRRLGRGGRRREQDAAAARPVRCLICASVWADTNAFLAARGSRFIIVPVIETGPREFRQDDERQGSWAVAALYLGLTFLLAYPLSVDSPSDAARPTIPTDISSCGRSRGTPTRSCISRCRIFDANIFYPNRNSLAYSENLIGSAVFAAPVLWLTGNPVLAVNVVSLLSCVLCGLGAYVLGRRVGLSPAAAVLTGLVFAFSPPRFFRFSQLHLTAVQWIPFSLASLHAYLDGGRKRDLRLASAVFHASGRWRAATAASFWSLRSSSCSRIDSRSANRFFCRSACAISASPACCCLCRPS